MVFKMNSALAKILLALVGVALFLTINIGVGDKKSGTQAAYELWLQETSMQLSTPAQPGALRPRVSLNLKSTYPELQVNWSVNSGGQEDEERKTLRLLELAKEAGFFNLPEGARGDPVMALAVEEGAHKFAASFRRDEIDALPAAQSFLKLFQLYSSQQTTPSLSQQ